MDEQGDGRRVTHHILPTSATMVGVCVTVMSILRIQGMTPSEHVLGFVLAVDCLVFLGSAVLSYLSLRKPGRAVALERTADTAFIYGLGLMVVAMVVFTLTERML